MTASVLPEVVTAGEHALFALEVKAERDGRARATIDARKLTPYALTEHRWLIVEHLRGGRMTYRKTYWGEFLVGGEPVTREEALALMAKARRDQR